MTENRPAPPDLAVITPPHGGINRFLDPVLGRIRTAPDSLYCRFVRGADVADISWAEFGRAAAGFADAYRQAGLGSGDIVLIFLRHTPHLYASFFGAQFARLVPSFMPCNSPRQDPALYWKSHVALFERAPPAAVVADRATAAEMRANGIPLDATRIIDCDAVQPGEIAALAAVAVPETEVALLQHSSGTTGLKKGVALSHSAIAGQLGSYSAALALREDDVIVSWLPLYHDMGLVACLLLPTWSGTPFVHLDAFEWVAQPLHLLDHVVRSRGTFIWLPNFAFEHLALLCGRRALSYDLSQVRAFINCSEPCKPASFDRFAKAFAPAGVRPDQMHCCYAMAETVFAVTQTELGAPVKRLRVDRASLQPGMRVQPASDPAGATELLEVGPVITGITVTIHDASRAKLPDGVVGEIGLSGAFLFDGYNKEPDRTAGCLSDGTYFSRDLGFMQDGRLYVLGRVDDLIIINGRNIYAHEVEAIVNAVPGLKGGRNVAVPVFDERVGSQTLVVIAERDPATPRPDAEISENVIAVVQSVMNVQPRAVHIVAPGWLVKTTSGKISREANLARLDRTTGNG